MTDPNTSPSESRAVMRGEALADAIVHFIGVVGALLAVPVLITLAAVWRGNDPLLAATVVYGITLIAMLSFSASYNVLSLRLERGRLVECLRRLDHAAIYAKIAGTYTPFAVIAGGPVGKWLLIAVWSFASLGMLAKMIMPDGWEKLSIAFYVGLGWAFLLVAEPVSNALLPATLALMVVGGLLYTVGVVFHVLKDLPYQNAIWHGFVLTASLAFFAAVTVEVTAGS